MLLALQDNDTLIYTLRYHVVAGNLPTSLLSNVDLGSLNGESVEVVFSEAGMMVNDANVLDADIIANNGVVHAIDTVLNPFSVVDILARDGRFSSLVAALTAAGLLETLRGEGPFTIFGEQKYIHGAHAFEKCKHSISTVYGPQTILV